MVPSTMGGGRPSRLWAWATGTIACLFLTAAGWGQERLSLEPPGQREFIRDLAGMVPAQEAALIRQVCDQLLTQKATPVIVVTIESMAKYGGGDMSIESFAMLLFNQWGIGHEKRDGNAWNRGILLLVSRDDRKARIELGAEWGHGKDGLCRKIMDEQIIPRFKRGDYSSGILAGVSALDKMVRGQELPVVRRPNWQYVFGAGAIALLFFTVVSVARRGTGGMAWLFWAAVFGLIGSILYSMLTNAGRGGSSGGGGFSGGSFGGGFSGGGGASGSW